MSAYHSHARLKVRPPSPLRPTHSMPASPHLWLQLIVDKPLVRSLNMTAHVHRPPLHPPPHTTSPVTSCSVTAAQPVSDDGDGARHTHTSCGSVVTPHDLLLVCVRKLAHTSLAGPSLYRPLQVIPYLCSEHVDNVMVDVCLFVCLFVNLFCGCDEGGGWRQAD